MLSRRLPQSKRPLPPKRPPPQRRPLSKRLLPRRLPPKRPPPPRRPPPRRLHPQRSLLLRRPPPQRRLPLRRPPPRRQPPKRLVTQFIFAVKALSILHCPLAHFGFSPFADQLIFSSLFFLYRRSNFFTSLGKHQLSHGHQYTLTHDFYDF